MPNPSPELPADRRASLQEAYEEAAGDLDILVQLAVTLRESCDDEPTVATYLTKGLLRNTDVWTPLMLCTVLGAAVARLAGREPLPGPPNTGAR